MRPPKEATNRRARKIFKTVLGQKRARSKLDFHEKLLQNETTGFDKGAADCYDTRCTTLA